jgi:hypothetical protein
LKARLLKLKARTARSIAKFRPRVTRTAQNLRRIGTEYGGWTFVDHPELRGSLVVCAGAGEDISFDIGFAREYDSRAVIVDPTPRAILHVEEVIRRLRDEVPRTAELNDTGKQDVRYLSRNTRSGKKRASSSSLRRATLCTYHTRSSTIRRRMSSSRSTRSHWARYSTSTGSRGCRS